MKKIFIILTFIVIFLIACSKETYTLKSLYGVDSNDFDNLKCSNSIFQSFAWTFSKENYKYIDVEYVKSNKNMIDKIYDEYKQTNLVVSYSGNEMCLQFYFVNDYIYLYDCNNDNEYVSKYKTDIDYNNCK